MGHKVHPKIHRLQVIYTWDSRWFKKRDYAAAVKQDIRIRKFLAVKYRDAHIDAIGIERGPKNMTIRIVAAKPGLIIGRGGQGLEELRKTIERKFLQLSLKVKLQIQELRNPSLSAAVVAETMVAEIERRLPFRRVMKQAMERVMKAGALGVKVNMAGRLNGVEIARTEMLATGKVPLITLRSDINYAFTEAYTTYGKIGIKAWIYLGEVFGRKDIFAESAEEPSHPTQRRVAEKTARH